MAIQITPNLKLRVDSSLSTESKYNLYKIDELAGIYQVDTTGTARIRSRGNIVFLPNDTDLGGTGVGGQVDFGTVDNPVTQINLLADNINSTADQTTSSDISTSGAFILRNGNFGISLTAPVLSASYSLALPVSVGTPNQVLTTDGLGQTSWTTIGGVDLGQELSVDWVAADGAIKVINHGFGTRKIIVQVLDATDSYRNVELDSITRPSDNTIILESSVVPVSWVVLLKEIP